MSIFSKTVRSQFQALWDRIKPKTTYRVEFETDVLVQRAVDALKRMEHIGTPRIRISAGQLGVDQGEISTTAVSVAEEQVRYEYRPVPDLLAYLQNETELTRSTLVRILKASGRLDEFFNNPQRFMDAVAAILKHELHRLLVDGSSTSASTAQAQMRNGSLPGVWTNGRTSSSS